MPPVPAVPPPVRPCPRAGRARAAAGAAAGAGRPARTGGIRRRRRSCRSGSIRSRRCRTSVPAQVELQVVPLQIWPLAQTFVQLPQWAASDGTQEPLHSSWPDGHAHWLFWQVLPAATGDAAGAAVVRVGRGVHALGAAGGLTGGAAAAPARSRRAGRAVTAGAGVAARSRGASRGEDRKAKSEERYACCLHSQPFIVNRNYYLPTNVVTDVAASMALKLPPLTGTAVARDEVLGGRRHGGRHHSRRRPAGDRDRHRDRRGALVDGHHDDGAIRALVARDQHVRVGVPGDVHRDVAGAHELAVVAEREVALGDGRAVLDRWPGLRCRSGSRPRTTTRARPKPRRP